MSDIYCQELMPTDGATWTLRPFCTELLGHRSPHTALFMDVRYRWPNNWQRWMQQAVDRLREAGEWDETGTASTDTSAEGEPHGVDPADRDRIGHGDQMA